MLVLHESIPVSDPSKNYILYVAAGLKAKLLICAIVVITTIRIHAHSTYLHLKIAPYLEQNSITV
jgi:hypothetical protein